MESEIKRYNDKVIIKTIKNMKINNNTINKLYKELINNQYSFIIIKNNKNYILTKEKSLIEQNIEQFIKDYLNDKYYKTIYSYKEIKISNLNKYFYYLKKYEKFFNKKYENYLFGTVALKLNKNSFIITIRGKKDLKDYSIVKNINHRKKQITITNKNKPALNAPLMDYIFKTNQKVQVIVMLHHIYNEKYQTLSYAPSGTYRDSIRTINKSINIDNHGCILLFDKNDNIIE